jgi:hypothetical protein
MVTWYHKDHGLSQDHVRTAELLALRADGFFMVTVDVTKDGGDPVPCALYGPAMGDEPIAIGAPDTHYVKRSEDRPESRMVARPMRTSHLLTVIGHGEGGENSEPVIYTAYGGPVAPREPNDPTLETDEEKREAHAFWRDHALAMSVEQMASVVREEAQEWAEAATMRYEDRTSRGERDAKQRFNAALSQLVTVAKGAV